MAADFTNDPRSIAEILRAHGYVHAPAGENGKRAIRHVESGRVIGSFSAHDALAAMSADMAEAA